MLASLTLNHLLLIVYCAVSCKVELYTLILKIVEKETLNV